MKTLFRWKFISTKALHEKIDTEAYLEMLNTVDDIKGLFRKKIKRPFHFGDNILSFDKGGGRFNYFYVSKGVNHVQVSLKDDGCIYFYFYHKPNHHSELKICSPSPFKAFNEHTLYHAIELSVHFLTTGNPCLN